MMKRWINVLFLAALIPANANAQAPQERIDAARERVAAAGLPTAILQDRLNEGRAKNVPLERIAAAVERRADALLAAADALRPTGRSISNSEFAAGADAIEAGIPGAALREVVSGARAEDRPVALAVLTYLHTEHGLPVDQAVARVTEAMARGSSALRDLPAQAAAGARNRPQGSAGGPPEGAPGRGARPSGAGPDVKMPPRPQPGGRRPRS